MPLGKFDRSTLHKITPPLIPHFIGIRMKGTGLKELDWDRLMPHSYITSSPRFFEIQTGN
ncbi:MAG: hypothetical protein AAGD96_17965 [Chloroflexota bacterium]